MCVGGGKTAAAPAPAPAPAPIPEQPVAPLIAETSAATKTALANKAGKGKLRVDLNQPTEGGTGLNIPT